MSIGPLSPNQLAAAVPLAQDKGARAERALQEAASHARRVEGEQRSESAARIETLDGEKSVTDDHDSDGRMPWQAPAPVEEGPSAENTAGADNVPGDDRAVGRDLDLTA